MKYATPSPTDMSASSAASQLVPEATMKKMQTPRTTSAAWVGTFLAFRWSNHLGRILALPML